MDPQSPSRRKNVLFAILSALVFVLFIEIAGRAAVMFQESRDSRLSFPGFKDTEWAAEVLKIFDKDIVPYIKFDPYVVWSVKDFRSQYVNVDSLGRRKTWNPDFENKKPTKVYFFGGSTAFGGGARDEYTIASYLSRFLNEKDSRFIVWNYGQPAYRSEQELLKLQSLLLQGNRPDYVIFYHGHNDVTASYVIGDANGLIEEESIRKKFEATDAQSISRGIEGLVKKYCKSCLVVVRGGKTLWFKLSGANPHPTVGSTFDEAQLDALAGEVVDRQKAFLDFLDYLSRNYGFRYSVFWQPTLLGSESVAEEAVLEKTDFMLADAGFRSLYKKVHEGINKIRAQDFYDISDVLDRRTSQLYYDNVHITEEGNEIVAKKIFEILKQGVMR